MKLTYYIVTAIFALFVLSCGRRTAPEPYGTIVSTLPPVKIFKATFQGRHLKVSWPEFNKKDDDNRIFAFQINAYLRHSTCYNCQAKLMERIDISSKNGDIIVHKNRKEKSTGFYQYFKQNKTNYLMISDKKITEWSHKGQFYLTINYITDELEISPESSQVVPHRPLDIPLPEIQSKKVVVLSEIPSGRSLYYVPDELTEIFGFEGLIGLERIKKAGQWEPDKVNWNMDLLYTWQIKDYSTREDVKILSPDWEFDLILNGCRATKVMMNIFLVIEWTQKQETVQHLVQADGTMVEKTKFYGINLYQIEKKENVEIEKPVNAGPLFRGIISLEGFNGSLAARHIDRFGNESEKILISQRFNIN